MSRSTTLLFGTAQCAGVLQLAPMPTAGPSSPCGHSVTAQPEDNLHIWPARLQVLDPACWHLVPSTVLASGLQGLRTCMLATNLTWKLHVQRKGSPSPPAGRCLPTPPRTGLRKTSGRRPAHRPQLQIGGRAPAAAAARLAPLGPCASACRSAAPSSTFGTVYFSWHVFWAQRIMFFFLHLVRQLLISGMTVE